MAIGFMEDVAQKLLAPHRRARPAVTMEDVFGTENLPGAFTKDVRNHNCTREYDTAPDTLRLTCYRYRERP